MADAMPIGKVESDFYVLPQDLKVVDTFNVRRFDGGSDKEAREIEALAKSIDEDGQLDTVLVIENKEGEMEIVSGHHRTRAIALVNEKRSRSGQSLLKVRVRIDNDGDTRRKALSSNLQRQDLSAMDLATLIRDLRPEFGASAKGAKAITEYLGLGSVATVTQHEKLLTAAAEVQEQVHAGVLSVQAALDMLKVEPAQQMDVLKRAEEIQQETDEKLQERSKKARAKKTETAGAVESTAAEAAMDRAAEGEPEKKSGKIGRPAVVQAIREQNASKTAIIRSRKELLESLDEFDGPAYGHEDGAIRVWVRYFVDQFATGKGTMATMRKKFDAMTAKAPKGTKKPEVKEEPKKKEAKAKVKAPAKKKAAAKTADTGTGKKRGRPKKQVVQ